jgi:uncharacterized protein with HEPN domain
MRRDARAYLWDIQQASDAILRFIADYDATTFAEDELVYSAVERKFEIIGEALGQLAKVDPALAGRIPDMRDIIAFRNVLIHGYAGIEHRRVWDIAQSSLPRLRMVVEDLLREIAG